MTPQPQVTIAIPTYNRSGLLKVSLESALAQDYRDLNVIVLDNSSSDDTEAVVRPFADARITYVRNRENIGLYRNWNRAIEMNTRPYLALLQDDDVMLPGFVRESVLALERHPHAAFSYTHARFIDIDGQPLHLQDTRNVPHGEISGLDYLHQIAAGDNWVIHASSVMMRATALAAVGPFDVTHSKHTIDFNLYFRLAAHYDLVFVPKELVQIRRHSGADHVLSPQGTGPLAMIAERTDTIAYLLQSVRGEDPSFRSWLAERLLHISMRRSELTAQLVPDLNLSWTERLEIATQEVATLIPAGESFVLVDENLWGFEVPPGLRALPFLERDGHYWGPPADDKTAVRELERMRRSGVSYAVIGWPAFWWLDYYSGLREYLGSNFRCVLRNSRLVVFDLRRRPESDGLS
jgi:glycosyltransferase involved in cell wall biosynthesis